MHDLSVSETKACPHCQAVNAGDAGFCESCGMALPELDSTGPRIIDKGGVASTRAGRVLQSDELRKESRKAAGALLLVAILQVVFGTFLLFIMPNLLVSSEEAVLPPAVYVTVYGLGVVFFGLYLWARKQPLPAAIVGLVLFISMHLLDALVDPSALLRGVIVKVFIVLILVRAVSAGARYRQLLAQARAVLPQTIEQPNVS